MAGSVLALHTQVWGPQQRGELWALQAEAHGDSVTKASHARAVRARALLCLASQQSQ